MKRIINLVLALILAGLFLFPLSVEASSENDVLDLINEYRACAGLDGMIMDEDLNEVAAIRANECSQKFSHTRPNGQAWYTVSKLTNGENLAHAVNYNQQKPENVVYAWMLSPKHSANVLRSSFSYVGIAYYCNDEGETFIACEFR
ncbi:MAG: CAP domain-containing protein [Butyrivibrio sp.]|nr:CAP domain-containing protein [Butyrivibrio sp.]